MTRLLRCGLTATFLMLALSLLPVESSGAGTYEVVGCTLPGGKKVLAIDGWSPIQSAPGGTQNACFDFSPPLNPSLLAWLDPNSALASGSLSGWTFKAPPDTYVSGVRLYRYARTVASGASNGSYGGKDWYLLRDSSAIRPLDDHILETCVAPIVGCAGLGSSDRPYDRGNVLEAHGLRTYQISAVVACDTDTPAASCNPTPARAEFGLFATDVELTDLSSPEIASGPRGSLLDPSQPLEGEKVVQFSAADHGGGLKTLNVFVDGQSLAEQPADPHSSTCTPPYARVVPCPAHADATFAVDTAQLPNGRHVVQAAAIDVAGNRTLSVPVAVNTVNGSRPNGTNASRFARVQAWFASKTRRHTSARTVAFRHTTRAYGAVRTRAGVPISGATIEILSRLSRLASAYRRIGSAHTDARGRFTWKTRRGASRVFRFGYRAATLDPDYASSADLRLAVRAKVTFAVRVVRGRGSFTGRLVGAPGRRGTLVSIYAVERRGGRHLIPVESVRADRRGRFRYRYVFRTLRRPTRFRFQAVVRPQANYPYALGRSRIVSVIARP